MRPGTVKHQHVRAGDLNGDAGPFKIVADCPVAAEIVGIFKTSFWWVVAGHRFEMAVTRIVTTSRGETDEWRGGRERRRERRGEYFVIEAGHPRARKQPSCLHEIIIPVTIRRPSRCRLDSISSNGFERERRVSATGRGSPTRRRRNWQTSN